MAEFDDLYKAIEACSRASRRAKSIVQILHTHFDALSVGLKRLREFAGELTEETRAAVQRAANIRDHEGAQLREFGLDEAGAAALERVKAHLDRERPWRDIKALDADLADLRACYIKTRGLILTAQDSQVESAIGRLYGRDGFRRLSADASDRILEPLRRVRADTTAEAVAPSLRELVDRFEPALDHALAEAGARLNELVSRTSGQIVRNLSLSHELRDREVKTEADVERLVADIRARLLAHVREGERIILS
ncbi:hypothetical protein OV079_49385 [Nannocystis pusilla]|uniref:Uncharacterized protein n=1 Tax=Nannocystis pusilla TaxID=889268 RepID=A0A9X3EZS8_9BACT|nr:hypothetical protein [Nannocystis pusilla]MCY1013414.1 hypothetical protein [Nannocystis pusilla]